MTFRVQDIPIHTNWGYGAESTDQPPMLFAGKWSNQVEYAAAGYRIECVFSKNLTRRVVVQKNRKAAMSMSAPCSLSYCLSKTLTYA